MSFFGMNRACYLSVGEDTYMSQAPLPGCSPVLSTALGVYIDHFFFEGHLSHKKGSTLASLPGALWLSGGCQLAGLPWKPSQHQPPQFWLLTGHHPHGVSQESSSQMECGRRYQVSWYVWWLLFYVFTFTYPNNMYFSPDRTVNYQPLLVQSSMKDILGTCSLKKEPLFS